jgi:hypothetical protein
VHSLARALHGALFDVDREHGTGPPMFQGSSRVGEARLSGLQLGQEDHMMTPRHFANRMLAKVLRVGPGVRDPRALSCT